MITEVEREYAAARAEVERERKLGWWDQDGRLRPALATATRRYAIAISRSMVERVATRG